MYSLLRGNTTGVCSIDTPFRTQYPLISRHITRKSGFYFTGIFTRFYSKMACFFYFLFHLCYKFAKFEKNCINKSQ